MLMRSLGIFRLLLGRPSPLPASGSVVGSAREQEAPRGNEDRPSGGPGVAEATGHKSAATGDEDKETRRAPELSRLMTAYLNARAEETLALLIEELARETTKQVGQAVERTGRVISTDIAGVREDFVASQRELSRIGRELVRSGAILEAIKAATASTAPTLERLEEVLRAELARGSARDQQLREELERAALEDILVTLDGLEAGLEEGRELAKTLGETQRRLKDATVQRWWRALGEATGAKRPLPDVPLADVESLVGGLELTYRRLLDALARRGVTPIEAAGHPFDPHLHEAVAVEPCPEEQDGLVLREQRRGYRSPERVIRLVQVVVGRGVATEPDTKQGRPRRSRAGAVEDFASPTADGPNSEELNIRGNE
ncbi:MAG: nucleotide exchange factor GrpE [Chloroflexi bacterium]|nr:nucleotide exchange factor GrpE [Chloroflexota bacterium]